MTKRETLQAKYRKLLGVKGAEAIAQRAAILEELMTLPKKKGNPAASVVAARLAQDAFTK